MLDVRGPTPILEVRGRQMAMSRARAGVLRAAGATPGAVVGAAEYGRQTGFDAGTLEQLRDRLYQLVRRLNEDAGVKLLENRRGVGYALATSVVVRRVARAGGVR